MPRGVPKAGKRMPRGQRLDGRTGHYKNPIFNQPNFNQGAQYNVSNVIRMDVPAAKSTETDEQISEKIGKRFRILEVLTQSCIDGESRALIVSGPAGLGKSFTVERALKENFPDEDGYGIVKGVVRATGLFRKLFEFRHPGCVLVFDDADSVFKDENALNLLKAACDTTEDRHISMLSEYEMFDDDGELLPKSFLFEGTVIFITNYDFDAAIKAGHGYARHFEAMISRAHYIDLSMKTPRDYFVRILQVVKEGMLREVGCTPTEQAEVIYFIEEHIHDLRELSLRAALKIAALRRSDPETWEDIATVTCCLNK